MSPEELIAVIERGMEADERDASDIHDLSVDRYMGGDCICDYPSRVLADVESKREILAQYDPRFGNDFVWHPILAALARPYLDREAP